jgi:hypothetical protein
MDALGLNNRYRHRMVAIDGSRDPVTSIHQVNDGSKEPELLSRTETERGR